MTQEEKAKAYDEMLQRVKELHEAGNFLTQKQMEIICPELAKSENPHGIDIPFGAYDSELKGWEYTIPEGMEAVIKDGKIIVRERDSEDERVRKDIIALIKFALEDGSAVSPGSHTTKEEALAYLEKQKEQKHPDGCFTCDEYKKGYEEGRRNGFTAGYNKAIKEVEQNVEQKSVDNSVYPPSLEEAIRLYYDTYGNGGGGFDYMSLPKFQDIVETFVKDYGQKPVEWNEDWREEDIQTRFAFYTYKEDPCVLYLSNVFVEESSRNHGFGTRILKAAEKVAEVVGATTISLKVKQDSLANTWYRKNGYSFVTSEDGYDWLKKNLEYLNSKEFKQEWNEDDEQYLLVCRNALYKYQLSDRWDANIIFDWLEKRLKSTYQPKQEWSDEDERMLTNIIERGSSQVPPYEAALQEEQMEWLMNRLKSLRPKHHWKPSEEQMTRLNECVIEARERHRASTSSYERYRILNSLYNDLKKLM